MIKYLDSKQRAEFIQQELAESLITNIIWDSESEICALYPEFKFSGTRSLFKQGDFLAH